MSCLLDFLNVKMGAPALICFRVHKCKKGKLSDSECLELKNMFVIPTFQLFEVFEHLKGKKNIFCLEEKILISR